MINKSRTNQQKTPYSLEYSNMVSGLWCLSQDWKKLWSWFLVSNVLLW